MSDDTSSKDIIWAPWRMDYILSRDEYTDACFLCEAVNADASAWKEHKLLWKSNDVSILLNKFPYNNGHALLAPVRHVADLTDLERMEHASLMEGVETYVRAARSAMDPDGFNIGVNLGEAAGAGLPEHLHVHVVPRWEGDVNFMPVTGDTRVMPQSLEALYDTLRKELADDS